MKFVESILSNNTTDDHCQEFVNQKGLLPLVTILGLPNLPIDFPTSAACQAVAGVCKSILVRSIWPNIFISFRNQLCNTSICMFLPWSPLQLKHNEKFVVMYCKWILWLIVCHVISHWKVKCSSLSLVCRSNIRVFWKGKCISKKALEVGFNTILYCFTMYFFPLSGLILVYFKHGWSVVHCSNFALKMKLL